VTPRRGPLAPYANRKAAVEDVIANDPVAVCVPNLMAERGRWMGRASELLRAANDRRGGDGSSAGWPKNPALPSGRLRRAQTLLRVWILKYISVERAEQEAGQSLVAGAGPRPSGLSAPSARFATTSREVHKENYKLGKFGGYERH
jgi:hypothetical protein